MADPDQSSGKPPQLKVCTRETLAKWATSDVGRSSLRHARNPMDHTVIHGMSVTSRGFCVSDAMRGRSDAETACEGFWREDLRRDGLAAAPYRSVRPCRARGRRMSAAEQRHVSVLGPEAVAALAPRANGIYVDATFGAGGYSRLMLATPGTRVIGIDRDPTAIASGRELLAQADGRLTLIEDKFSHLAEICEAQGIDAVDGVVMDVGVSSMQLDEAGRGFSFRLDGPLDMRMGGDGPTAADVVARAGERELADLIYIFGEERHSRGVTRAIVAAQKKQPNTTTQKHTDIVGRVVRSKPGDIHPATRTFQALRILVNEELDELDRALSAAERMLKPGGRLEHA